MDTALVSRVEPWLGLGFAAVGSLWLVMSAYVIADRLRYDRQQGRLRSVRRALADPSLAALPALDRSVAVRDLLAQLSRDVAYRMTGDADLAPWVRECCAKFALEHVGLQRLLRDATPHRGARRKWRRISALHALVYARPDSIHALLRAALADADADVASAAASVLLRIGDERAAEILIGGLRSARLPASRIAARLERFTIPIDDLLRPLLTSPRAEARYWAVTLLRNQHDHRGLAAEIVPLVDDADASVRKSALLTLAAMQSPEIGRLATWRLTDPVPYVRSAAINALAQTGERTPDRARRQAIAAGIASSLADRDWSVRTTAKEALAQLGPATWRAVAAQLSSTDAFARNGAAEVLQNLGVLDWTLRGIASGVRPTDEALDVLKRALREGGVTMADAAVLRTKSEPIPDVHELLRSLDLQGAAS
jgi:HEAT repeat protein